MKISMILAIGKNGELGKDNKLLWHIPEELKNFQKLTKGKYLFMGRNTFDSILSYNKKPLQDRISIVLTSKDLDESEIVQKVSSFEEAIDNVERLTDELIIIGGASVYDEFFDSVSQIYLTVVDKEFNDADAFFKKDLSDFKVIKEEKHEGWVFKILERK